MLEETVVLRGEERVPHELRNLFVGDRIAALLADLRDQLAVARVDAQRHRKLDCYVIAATRRQRGFQIHIAADEGVCRQKCDDRHTASTAGRIRK